MTSVTVSILLFIISGTFFLIGLAKYHIEDLIVFCSLGVIFLVIGLLSVGVIT